MKVQSPEPDLPPELTYVRSTSTIPDVPEEFSVTTKSLEHKLSESKELPDASKDAFKVPDKTGSISKYL